MQLVVEQLLVVVVQQVHLLAELPLEAEQPELVQL
jgi:hypothetical protein